MKWLAFDTEDNGRDLKAKHKIVTQIYAKCDTGEIFYETKNPVQKFKKFLISRSSALKPIVCWAHNCQYDIGNLFWDSLDDLRYGFVQGKFIRATWGKRIKFLDSSNIFPESIAQLGEQIKLPKLTGHDEKTSKAYVQRDVEILWQIIDALYSFCGEYSMLPGSTISGTSAKIWKSMGGENWFCDSPFVKEAYFGGRSEIFTSQSVGRVAHTDINSLYPWALTQKFPEEIHQGGDIDREGIVSARVSVPETDLTVLPVRNSLQAVSYPFGTFNGYWTCYELREAVKRGAVIEKVFNIFTAKRNAYYYRDFATEMYKKRLESDDPYRRKMFKQVLNSFTGQLAMRGVMQTSAELTPERAKKPGLIFGSQILMDISPKLPDHVNFLHAAYVTSMARVRLIEFIEKIGVENMLYCGTDSCIFSVGEDSEIPFEISEDIGEMKIEGISDHGASVKNIGLYKLGNKYVAKGVPKIVAQEYFKFGLAKYLEPVGFHESIKSIDHSTGNIKRKMSHWEHKTKIRRGKYNKKNLIGGIYLPKRVKFNKYYQKSQISP